MKEGLREFWELTIYEAKRSPLYVAFNVTLMAASIAMALYIVYLLIIVLIS